MRRKCFTLTGDDIRIIQGFLQSKKNINGEREDIQALFKLLNDAAQVDANGECEHSILIMWVVSKVLSRKELGELNDELKKTRRAKKYSSHLGERGYINNEAYGCLNLVCKLTKSNESEVIMKYLTPVLNDLLSQGDRNKL